MDTDSHRLIKHGSNSLNGLNGLNGFKNLWLLLEFPHGIIISCNPAYLTKGWFGSKLKS